MLSIIHNIINSTPTLDLGYLPYRKGVAVPIILVSSHIIEFHTATSPCHLLLPFLAWKHSVSSDSSDLLCQPDVVNMTMSNPEFYRKKTWVDEGYNMWLLFLQLIGGRCYTWCYIVEPCSHHWTGHQSSIQQPQNIQIPAWKLRLGLLPSSSSHDNAFCTYISMHIHR